VTPQASDHFKTIRFEGQMLPHWAQLLDLAARLSPVPEETRGWFSRFTSSAGVDDSRTIFEQCNLLRTKLIKSRSVISSELRRGGEDVQPSQILAAWQYALETMIQEARTKKTCSWRIEGQEETGVSDSSGGNITLRRA
jgi:hypothetical protein